MEQAAVKRKKLIVPFLIGLLILSSIVFIKHLTNRMNSYIEKNGKISMGAVVEQMQQTYELQTSGYYSRLHLVEDYLLQEKELSLETEVTSIFLRRGKRIGKYTPVSSGNGKAITADGTKIRMDIPSKLLLDLRNGRNIAKLVAWNHEEIQNGAYLVAIPCQPYRVDGETYTAVGTVYNHAKLDSMLKLKGYHGNAYLFLLDNEGNITYTNQSKDVFFRNYSLLKHLRKNQAITEGEVETLQKRLVAREQGVELLGGKSPYYLGYCPIESNHSMLICIVAKGVVDNTLTEYQKAVSFTTMFMVGFIILLFAGLFYSVSRLSIADQKAKYEKEIMNFKYRR